MCGFLVFMVKDPQTLGQGSGEERQSRAAAGRILPTKNPPGRLFHGTASCPTNTSLISDGVQCLSELARHLEHRQVLSMQNTQ